MEFLERLTQFSSYETHNLNVKYVSISLKILTLSIFLKIKKIFKLHLCKREINQNLHKLTEHPSNVNNNNDNNNIITQWHSRKTITHVLLLGQGGKAKSQLRILIYIK